MKKLAAAVTLSMLCILPADASQRNRQIGPPVPFCDNNGRCVGAHETRSAPGSQIDRRKTRGKNSVAPRPVLDANGNEVGAVVSAKTGARTRVGAAYAARFQAYIDDLENNYGARILFMGGIRPGRCSVASEHPCGKALDVCQLRRGVVDPRCHLPGRALLAEIAASHGLFEGGRWCNSDYGHAQVGVTAAACDRRGTRIVQE
jgi:hypothetical protein